MAALDPADQSVALLDLDEDAETETCVIPMLEETQSRLEDVVSDLQTRVERLEGSTH
jgi:hypothetical protein